MTSNNLLPDPVGGSWEKPVKKEKKKKKTKKWRDLTEEDPQAKSAISFWPSRLSDYVLLICIFFVWVQSIFFVLRFLDSVCFSVV